MKAGDQVVTLSADVDHRMAEQVPIEVDHDHWLQEEEVRKTTAVLHEEAPGTSLGK